MVEIYYQDKIMIFIATEQVKTSQTPTLIPWGNYIIPRSRRAETKIGRLLG